MKVVTKLHQILDVIHSGEVELQTEKRLTVKPKATSSSQQLAVQHWNKPALCDHKCIVADGARYMQNYYCNMLVFPVKVNASVTHA